MAVGLENAVSLSPITAKVSPLSKLAASCNHCKPPGDQRPGGRHEPIVAMEYHIGTIEVDGKTTKYNKEGFCQCFASGEGSVSAVFCSRN